MFADEKRQYFRIEDNIYFEYRVISHSDCFSDKALTQELLKLPFELSQQRQHLQNLDQELLALIQGVSKKEPGIARALTAINAKLDYISQQLPSNNKLSLRRVNLSLGGMAFTNKECLEKDSHLRIVIHTKPKNIPIILDATVVYSKPTAHYAYRIAVQFEKLTKTQEQLLAQHIMLAQPQVVGYQ